MKIKLAVTLLNNYIAIVIFIIGCFGPFFEHHNGPDLFLNGERWNVTCEDGFNVQTEVLVRECVINRTVPDFFEKPVECIWTGMLFYVELIEHYNSQLIFI